MLTLQLLPAARLAVHALALCAKSPGFVPPRAMLEIVNAALPLLASVMV
jgi:hypothetical protein